MKRNLFIICSVALAVLAVSCSSTQKVTRTASPEGMVEQTLPFSEAKYHSDADAYRAVQSGVSTEMSMAKKIAIQNASQEIAAAVQTDLSSVIENYAKSQKLPSQEVPAYEESLTELTYSVVQQTISGITLVDEKMFKESNGAYRYFVCMELSKEGLKNNILEKVKNDEKLSSDFAYEEFKKIYEQKLAEFKNRQ
ncbi:MAG: hypothetical protein ACI35T_04685 [Alistipes sp.]